MAYNAKFVIVVLAPLIKSHLGVLLAPDPTQPHCLQAFAREVFALLSLSQRRYLRIAITSYGEMILTYYQLLGWKEHR